MHASYPSGTGTEEMASQRVVSGGGGDVPDRLVEWRGGQAARLQDRCCERCLDDTEHLGQITEHELRGDMQHAVPSAGELGVPAGIRPNATRMVSSIHFDNESGRGSCEVHNERPNDELPAEANPEHFAV